ncbi:Tyrosine-protein phosphatase non-receptor type 11 [Psilocybe cubensis]|uniref:Tyrosine-protein phosphatase non-receptor type 11 n=2 Tax=Psilocybe cubensis TaxID=181762 RepID=A0ACB8HEN7_PSICU|nr:Tyrosine-protein phosphatase non-receptor type 11 [Psilocybe cubensis]KAH9486396.1 Tyrosine-protein phosphatase non-receptor type 11 [Psilocybe cubensis]
MPSFLKSKQTTAKTTTIPPWLILANTDKHIYKVERLLSSREATRYAARDASHQIALKASESTQHDKSPVFKRSSQRKEGSAVDFVEYYGITAGLHEDNRDLNRYTDIIPYDRTRIIVHDGSPPAVGDESEGKRHERYLNANWVLEKFGHKWWIATQAPLRHTAHAFLSVMLQPSVRPPHVDLPLKDSKTRRVRTVVQLARNVENGRKKADAYFPSEVGRSVVVLAEHGWRAPPLKVTLLAKKAIDEAHCIQSTVSVAPIKNATSHLAEGRHGTGVQDEDNHGQAIVFNHLLYLSWPDHGVPSPEDRLSLVHFIQLVDRINRDTSQCPIHSAATTNHICEELDPDPPIIVGCSAGIGRTGAFVALSSLLRKYGFLLPAAHPTIAPHVYTSPLGPIPSDPDLQDDLVLQEVDSLREQRPGMVERKVQMSLIYEVLASVLASESN